MKHLFRSWLTLLRSTASPSQSPNGTLVEGSCSSCLARVFGSGFSNKDTFNDILYIDPVSGQKSFSKPQVPNHLAKINGSAGGEKEGFTEPIIANPISSWRDNFTTVFYSKKDALRYLESGNVKSCVMKPLRRDMSKDSLNVDMPSTGGETYSPPDPSKENEASKVLPNNPVTESNPNGSVTELNTNGSVTELNTNGIENPKPISSITGGDFSTPNTSRKGVRSISGGTFSSPKEDYSEWIPNGWIYKETATGKKLYSKPQVLNYLDGSSSNSKKRIEYSSSGAPDSSQNLTPADGSRPKRAIKKKGNSEKNADYEEVITTCPADGLPTGWIKELRTKIY